MTFRERPVTQLNLGRFRLCILADVLRKWPCAGAPPRLKRQVGFGKEDQDLVSASATAKHASCCRCAKRRPGNRDRGRPLPSSRPLVHSLCDHTTRSRLADGEAGKIPCVGFYGDRICGTSRSITADADRQQVRYFFPAFHFATSPAGLQWVIASGVHT